MCNFIPFVTNCISNLKTMQQSTNRHILATISNSNGHEREWKPSTCHPPHHSKLPSSFHYYQNTVISPFSLTLTSTFFLFSSRVLYIYILKLTRFLILTIRQTHSRCSSTVNVETKQRKKMVVCHTKCLIYENMPQQKD